MDTDRFFLCSDDKVIIRHNSGFFSNCSVSLHAIIHHFNNRQQLPTSVDFSRTFRNFAEPGASLANVYEEYFDPDPGLTFPFRELIDFPLYSLFDYRKEQFDLVAPLMKKYFTPSAAALAKGSRLRARYRLQTDNLLTICYRGTDKFHDTTLGSYDTFLDRAAEILSREPDLRVLVQTDQSQFLDRACERLGRVMAFEELPRTESNTVMHDIIDRGKVAWAQTFLGAIHLIADSRHLVLHTGNVARWICLYRGHTERVLQYYQPKGATAGEWLGDCRC